MDSKVESRRMKTTYSKTDARTEKKPRKRKSRSLSPNHDRKKEYRLKRKHSRSKSPYVPMKQEKRRAEASQRTESKEVPIRKPKETDMLNTRTGGAYIPPARLRMMQAQITDKSSVAYQRLAWEALKKSIHGHINKINVGNIGIIIKELLKENIVRGRGLLCRSVIQAQAASPTFTNVYAALVAAVNSRFPNIGELLLKRLVIQFKRGFKRNDKSICISSASFIAHLVNQRVAHEILALELLTLLVETPTDDSVEVAIAFLKECGQKLTEVSSKGVNAIFEMLRNILHEGQLDKRVQYMIEVMFQVWKDGFKDHPAVIEELELVPEEEQFTHLMMLDDATDSQDILNVFKFDEKYEENELKYKALSNEILGSDAESGAEDGSEGSGSEESEDEEEQKEKQVTIIDNTETNLVALRRTIYLTINSSLDFEECAHKLMKMQLKPGQEIELCHMFLDCCAEQRTYEKFYGLLAQRFCNINRIYISPFEEIFKDSYATAHRLDTNRLRNVSKFFAHLLFTDSISWEVLECVKLNEEDTTSSSRIYIKILFQELAEYMGLKKLNDRLQDPTLQQAFFGIFPRDNPKNTRFSINFFTSIGLGGLTDELREHLKQMPKNVPALITEIKLDSDSSSDSSSSSESSSSSSGSNSSDEENTNKRKDKKNKKKKAPQNPENEKSASQKDSNKPERWGHDGFYDTYGNNARRMEANQGKGEILRHRQVERNYDEERQRDTNEQKNGRDRSERDVRQNIRSRHNDGTIVKNNQEEFHTRTDDSRNNKGYHQTNRNRNDENYTNREPQNRDDRQIVDVECRDRGDGKRNIDRDRNTNNRNKRDRDCDHQRMYARDDTSRGDNKTDDSERYRNNDDRYIYRDTKSKRDKVGDKAQCSSRGRDDNRYYQHSNDTRNRNQPDSFKVTDKFTENEKNKNRNSRSNIKKIDNSDRYDDGKNNSSNDDDDDKHKSKNDRNKRDSLGDNEDRKYCERNKNKGKFDKEEHRKKHDDNKSYSNKNDKHKQTKSKVGNARDKNSISDSSDDEKCGENRREKNYKEKRTSKEFKLNRNSDASKSKKYEKHEKKFTENSRKSKDNSTTDSSDHEESDNRGLGSRYWDTFETESKECSKKIIEGSTPEKNNAYYERRKEHY